MPRVQIVVAAIQRRDGDCHQEARSYGSLPFVQLGQLGHPLTLAFFLAGMVSKVSTSVSSVSVPKK